MAYLTKRYTTLVILTSVYKYWAMATRDVVQPPVCSTKKEIERNLLSLSHLVTWLPVAPACTKPCETQICVLPITRNVGARS